MKKLKQDLIALISSLRQALVGRQLKGHEDEPLVNLKCFVRGHKLADETDSGYEHCERCRAHEWYSGEHAAHTGEIDVWTFTLPTLYYRYMSSLQWWWHWNVAIRIYDRCTCGKLRSILNLRIGKHEDCLPF